MKCHVWLRGTGGKWKPGRQVTQGPKGIDDYGEDRRLVMDGSRS